MKDGKPYSYTVLRYVHDVVTGEFVNVGVILYVPSTNTVMVRVRKTIGRMRTLFPELNRDAFVRTMNAAERSVAALWRSLGNDGALLKPSGDAAAIVGRVLPRDDSSLQWSSPGGTGITDNPEKTIKRLFERFVSRYDTSTTKRRTDDDVWQPVRQKLAQRDLTGVLEEKTIR